MWTCIHVEEYWGKIVHKLNLILSVQLDAHPQVLLLGLPSRDIKGSHQRRLLSILPFAPWKNILLRWIDNVPPTIRG